MKKNLVAWILVIVMLVVSATAYATTECQHENTAYYCTSAYRYRVEGDKCYAEYDTVEQCCNCGAKLGEGIRSEEREHKIVNGVCKSCGGTELVAKMEKTEEPVILLPDFEAKETISSKTIMNILYVVIAVAIAILVVLLLVLLAKKGERKPQKPKKSPESDRRKSSAKQARPVAREVSTSRATVPSRPIVKKTTSKTKTKKAKSANSLLKLFKDGLEEGKSAAKKSTTAKKPATAKKSVTEKRAPKHAAKRKEEMPEGTFD